MASEGVRMWAITSKHGRILPESIAMTQREAWRKSYMVVESTTVIQARIPGPQMTLESRGYRAVRVRVTIEEEKSDG